LIAINDAVFYQQEGVMRKTLAVLCALALCISAALQAQGKPGDAKPVTLKGYVVDAMCAAGIVKKTNPMEKAANHTRECCFHEACAASGFGLFYDGKWVKFDAKGSDLAKKALEVSKREKGMYFEVTGKMEGETFVVASLKEAKPKT
jgi:hypothetical protein